MSKEVLELHLTLGEVFHDCPKPSHSIMLRNLFLRRRWPNMLRCNQAQIPSMADPESVCLLTVTDLVPDDRAGTSPPILLTSSAALHLVRGTLCLPVVDRCTGQKCLMSTKIGACSDSTMVPLRMVQVDDGLHGFLADMQCPLVARIARGLRVSR